MKTLFLVFSMMVVCTTWSGTKAQPPTSVTECRKLTDLYLLIDGSDSMSSLDFRKELEFVQNVVNGLLMNPEDGFSVGVILFSNKLQEIPLGNVSNKVSLGEEINKLVHDRDGTYTHRAINRMTDSFAMYGRPDAQKFGILITDGCSRFPDETAKAAKKAKRSGVEMIAVGIGSSINIDELNTIASIPQFAMTVSDFNALTRLAETIATTVCDKTTTPSPTTSHKPPCRPVLYLPFDKTVSDVSAEKVYVRNDGVEILHDVPGADGGVAYFNRSSALSIAGFTNDDFRDKFLLTFHYKEYCEVVRSTKYEALVSNSGCEEPCSIAVSFDRGSNRTRAKLRTTVGKVEASVRNTFFDWKKVEYKYDGNQLTLTVNGVVERVVSTGFIATVRSALQIGRGCVEFDHFCGYIDELYVYKCLP